MFEGIFTLFSRKKAGPYALLGSGNTRSSVQERVEQLEWQVEELHAQLQSTDELLTERTRQVKELHAQLQSTDDLLKDKARQLARERKNSEVVRKDAQIAVVRTLIEPLEDMKRASQSRIPPALVHTQWLQGMLAAYTKFDATFSAIGASTFGNVGEEFDPTMHDAINRVDSTYLPEGTVAEVYQKGYIYRGTIISYAKVGVVTLPRQQTA